MINGLGTAHDAIGIGVEFGNIDASVKFYQEIPGLEFVEKLATRKGTGTMCRFRYVTFQLKKLSDLCKELQAKGVGSEVSENESRPGVRVAKERDPDGTITKLVELGNDRLWWTSQEWIEQIFN